MPYNGVHPKIHPSVFLADNCRVIGDVEIGEESSVWFGAVIRGDQNKVIIGKRTNIQEGVIVHATADHPCIIGDYITVGHNAVIHSCTVASFTLIGIGSVVLDGAVVGEGSIVAAGSVVPPGKEFPPRSLILGAPGRLVREISEEEYMRNITGAEIYVKLSPSYK
jgi:carbonic anhydrase/acetyltransferase-like protein (isoleucine patch superfamily)